MLRNDKRKKEKETKDTKIKLKTKLKRKKAIVKKMKKIIKGWKKKK